MQNKDCPKLLNCPFCGALAMFNSSIRNTEHILITYHFVQCSKCGISTYPESDFDCKNPRKVVADIWNKRTTDKVCFGANCDTCARSASCKMQWRFMELYEYDKDFSPLPFKMQAVCNDYVPAGQKEKGCI